MSISPQQAEAALERAECLYRSDAVNAALDRMAAGIATALAGKNPILLCVMTGGIVTTGHLLTRLRFPLQLDYLHATRYRGATSGGEIRWLARPALPLAGRAVLVVDDILDEGHTLAAILEYCREQGASEVHLAALVEKRHGRKAPGIRADFLGLEVEDRYVFGFGMDYQGYLRNLPAIYALGEGDDE
ncbi:MAG TPA: hypoxanthine-guanine phosphoribosyltransferase [Gammaproteobacteria bacterium]|nr:hypoxanthine-guanine phosphoribosyltransferase [Gammaproteobacteria bacterium]